MNKRIRKKVSKRRCPACGRVDGVWGWRRLKTRRYVEEFIHCFACGASAGPDKDLWIEVPPGWESETPIHLMIDAKNR